MLIYLDHAAATPVDKKVTAVMVPFYYEQFYNPSALYSGAREVKLSLENARSDVARIVGARPSEIIFTAGGTESANLAIKGIMLANPDGNCIVSAIEHDAVLKPAKNYTHKIAPVDHNGSVLDDKLKELIDEKTVLISIMLANNEIGTVQNISSISAIVREIRAERQKSNNPAPLYLHTDACQAPLYLDCNVARIGVDMMTLNGGKIHGPKQSGILYRKSSVRLSPIIEGGGQEFGVRSGTENIAQAVGFAKALSLSDVGKSARVKQVAELRDYFMSQLEQQFGATVTGSRQKRLANNVHVSFTGVDNERVLFALDDLGIAAAAGSACQASSDEPSHILKAIGKSDDYANGSIRFSLGKNTTKLEIDDTLTALNTAISA
jgi:cysteine desulfurase